MASVVLAVSSMDLSERPRLQQQNARPEEAAQQPTTQKPPEVTTEDTANRILSLPNEEKCAKRKSF